MGHACQVFPALTLATVFSSAIVSPTVNSLIFCAVLQSSRLETSSWWVVVVLSVSYRVLLAFDLVILLLVVSCQVWPAGTCCTNSWTAKSLCFGLSRSLTLQMIDCLSITPLWCKEWSWFQIAETSVMKIVLLCKCSDLFALVVIEFCFRRLQACCCCVLNAWMTQMLGRSWIQYSLLEGSYSSFCHLFLVWKMARIERVTILRLAATAFGRGLFLQL